MKLSCALLFLLLSSFSYSQNHIKPDNDALPWVHGKLPSNSSFIKYKVVMGEGEQLKDAQDDAVRVFLFELGAEQGVHISSETLISTQEQFSKGKSQFESALSDEIKVTQKGFEASFYRVGEYFETKRIYGTSKYICWQLYAIGQNLPTKVTNLQYTSQYSWDAMWRSALVAGWGQLYKKDYGKGAVFMGIEALSVGAIIYTNSKYNYNINRALESQSLDVRKEYNSRADDYFMYRNIAIGTCIGVVLWSIIDAVATDGAPKYLSQNSPLTLEFSNHQLSQLSLCYNF